jgi:hypothetical protein
LQDDLGALLAEGTGTSGDQNHFVVEHGFTSLKELIY